MRVHAAIIEATRSYMRGGVFRPSVVQVAHKAGCSRRSVFQHFGSVEALHEVAADYDTALSILDCIDPCLTEMSHDVRERVVKALLRGWCSRAAGIRMTPVLEGET